MTKAFTQIRNHARWLQLAVEVLAFVVLLIFALQYYPVADALGIVAAFVLAYAIPRMIYSRMRCNCRLGKVALMVLGLTLISLAFYTLLKTTVFSGATLQLPNLHSDDRGYLKWAIHFYDGSIEEPDERFIGFPLMILGLFKLFGVNVVWPIAANLMFTLLTVVIVGQTAARMFEDRVKVGGAKIAALAMVLTIILCYFTSQGIRVQKEALSYFGVSLCAYVFARVKCADNRQWTRLRTDIILYVLAVLILALVRNSMVVFMLVGAVIICIDNRKQWRYGLTLVGIALIAYGVGMHESNFFSVDRQMRVVASMNNGGNIMSSAYAMTGSQDIYGKIIGDYYHFPMWKKVAYTPLVSAVQYVIPFPWSPIQDAGIVEHFTRCQWGWYLVGGISLFFFLFLSWRRGRGLGWWALWPLACFMGVAFVTAGSVSRYVLPFQPLFAIIATYMLCVVREKHYRHSFAGFIAGYAVLLGIGLAICANL